MIIVAGPPGGGKSTHLSVKSWGVDWFNGDDRAAQLNASSYQNIPAHIRAASGQQLQQFIDSHIESRRSFVLKTPCEPTLAFNRFAARRKSASAFLWTILRLAPLKNTSAA